MVVLTDILWRIILLSSRDGSCLPSVATGLFDLPAVSELCHLEHPGFYGSCDLNITHGSQKGHICNIHMLHVLHTRMLSLRTLRVADSTILGYPSVHMIIPPY